VPACLARVRQAAWLENRGREHPGNTGAKSSTVCEDRRRRTQVRHSSSDAPRILAPRIPAPCGHARVRRAHRARVHRRARLAVSRSAPAGRQPASALPSRTRSRPGVARSELRDCGSDGPCSPAAANVAGNSRLGEGGKGRGRRGRRKLPLRRALLSACSWPPPPQARGRRPGSRRGEGLVGGG
jgi:hypothetical protein